MDEKDIAINSITIHKQERLSSTHLWGHWDQLTSTAGFLLYAAQNHSCFFIRTVRSAFLFVFVCFLSFFCDFYAFAWYTSLRVWPLDPNKYQGQCSGVACVA